MICGCVYVLLRERRLFLRSLILFGSLLIVDVFIVSQYFGLEQVVTRLEQTTAATEVRTYIFPELAETAERYWLAGSGLGTFAIAAAPYREAFPKWFFDHAHNDYAQFLIETGIIGLGILGALVVASLVHAIRVIVNRRNRLRTGIALAAFMSITAMAIHSTVDFNLQIPANAATLVIILAMVNSCSVQSSRKRRRVREPGTEDPALSA
jgi:O-antigen ligase